MIKMRYNVKGNPHQQNEREGETITTFVRILILYLLQADHKSGFVGLLAYVRERPQLISIVYHFTSYLLQANYRNGFVGLLDYN